MALSFIARFLSAIVVVYMLGCSLRILLTWMPGLDTGRAGELVARAVDPYLGWFRRFRFLGAGKFDFSPIAAVGLLAVLNNVLTTLAFAGSITLGLVLGMILGAAWSALAFFLSFFAACALLRVIAYAAHWNSLHPLWRTVDEFLNPWLYRINRFVYRDRIVNYLQGLVTGFAVLVFLWAAGRALAALLVSLLERLPF
jgi:YggT family protein